MKLLGYLKTYKRVPIYDCFLQMAFVLLSPFHLPRPFSCLSLLIRAVMLILSGNLNSHKFDVSFAIQNSFSAGSC